MEGFHEKPIYRGIVLNLWGAWTVCTVKRGLGEKEEGWYPNAHYGTFFRTTFLKNTSGGLLLFIISLFFIHPSVEILLLICFISVLPSKCRCVYLSVSSPNARKYGPEKLRIRTLFTQCGILGRIEINENISTDAVNDANFSPENLNRKVLKVFISIYDQGISLNFGSNIKWIWGKWLSSISPEIIRN